MGTPMLEFSSRAAPDVLEADYQLVQAQGALVPFLEAVNGLVAVLNPERQIVYASTDFVKSHGSGNVASLLGQRPGEALRCVHALERPGGCGCAEACTVCGTRDATSESLATGNRVIRECRLTVEAGHGTATLDLEVTASPWQLGDRLFTVLTLKDISADKRSKSLERVFFHDIMNAAGGLAGILDLMSDYEDLNYAKELVAMSTRTSQDIVDELAAFQSIRAAETGDLSLDLNDYDPAQLMREAAGKMQYHRVAHGRQLSINLDGAPAVMRTDRLLAERVLVNMLKNAFEAVPAGSLITMGCRRASGAQFWVRNPGTMPRDVQLQVFQRSFSTKHADRGLGTYSMRLLGEKYLGGQLAFSLGPDGIEFTFTLPATSP